MDGEYNEPRIFARVTDRCEHTSHIGGIGFDGCSLGFRCSEILIADANLATGCPCGERNGAGNTAERRELVGCNEADAAYVQRTYSRPRLRSQPTSFDGRASHS